MQKGKSGEKSRNSVEFQAVVQKVQTLVDGGLRVTLDLPETAIPQAAYLMDFKRNEDVLRVVVSPEMQV